MLGCGGSTAQIANPAISRARASSRHNGEINCCIVGENFRGRYEDLAAVGAGIADATVGGGKTAIDEYGFVAPALNDDAHAWHHPDRQLIEMILNGSSRNQRMIAWKATLSRENAENLVAYIKNLWSFRSLACQGGRHMKCMR